MDDMNNDNIVSSENLQDCVDSTVSEGQETSEPVSKLLLENTELRKSIDDFRARVVAQEDVIRMLREEARNFKKFVVEEIVNYNEGCSSGKREFINVLGLEAYLPTRRCEFSATIVLELEWGVEPDDLTSFEDGIVDWVSKEHDGVEVLSATVDNIEWIDG